jgi:hypothetical protein
VARLRRWVYADTEMVFSDVTTPQTRSLTLDASPPVGSTVQRIIGHVDVWLVAPIGSVVNYQLRLACHNLGAGASIDDGTANSFPRAFLWWTSMGLYMEHWDPIRRRYWARNSVSFDVDGDRKLTASNPSFRFAAQPTGVPREDGFIVVTADFRTIVLWPDGITPPNL